MAYACNRYVQHVEAQESANKRSSWARVLWKICRELTKDETKYEGERVWVRRTFYQGSIRVLVVSSKEGAPYISKDLQNLSVFSPDYCGCRIILTYLDCSQVL